MPTKRAAASAAARNESKKPRNVEPEEDGENEEEPFRKDFYQSVYNVVRLIPEGKVASYGTIGQLIGHPRHSRMVGAALKCLPPSMSNPYLPPPSDHERRPPRARQPTNSSVLSTSSSSSTSSPPAGTIDVFDWLSGDHPRLDETVSDNDDAGGVMPAPIPNPLVVPWWRVVSSTGVISPRGNDRAVQRQADYLIAEGVQVKDPTSAPTGGAGANHFGLMGGSGGRVSMATYAWKG